MCTTISVYVFLGVCVYVKINLTLIRRQVCIVMVVVAAKKVRIMITKQQKKVRQQKQHDANLDKPLEKCFPCLASGQFVG